jgi:hypothetical protein
MLAASIPSGGHISHGKKEHSGTAGLVHGLNIEHYPFSKEDMTIWHLLCMTIIFTSIMTELMWQD